VRKTKLNDVCQLSVEAKHTGGQTDTHTSFILCLERTTVYKEFLLVCCILIVPLHLITCHYSSRATDRRYWN